MPTLWMSSKKTGKTPQPAMVAESAIVRPVMVAESAVVQPAVVAESAGVVLFL